MKKTVVISLGGSLIAPDTINSEYLGKLVKFLFRLCGEDSSLRFILVTGGGRTARIYQNAYEQICLATQQKSEAESADWIGVMATRLNAELLKQLLHPLCVSPVIYDPTENYNFEGKILVAAGWKPGFSSDFDAVLLAKKWNAKQIINLSNIAQVYSDDPAKNPAAKPFSTMSWGQLQDLVGTTWVPGKNVPFDPIATREAQKLDLTLIVASGTDLENLENILHKKTFLGTVVSSAATSEKNS